MKNKRLISSFLVMFMTTTACTPPSNKSSGVRTSSMVEKVSKLGTAQSQWIRLTDSENPNYALAELLTPWLWSLDANGLISIQSQTQNHDPHSSISQNLISEFLQMKQNFILGEKSYIHDPGLITNSVFSEVTSLESEDAFGLQIRLRSAAAAQAQAFLKIQSAFDEKIKNETRDIGRDIVGNLDPDIVEQINATKNKGDKVGAQEIYQLLKKWDRRLASYDFASEDGDKLVIYGYVASELYSFLKVHDSVKDIVHVAEELRGVGQKITEVRIVLKAMDQYRENLTQGWDLMKEAMSGIQTDIAEHPEWAAEFNPKITDQSAKETAHLIKNILLGEDIGDSNSEGQSFLSEGRPMGKNVKKFFAGAAKTSQSVDYLINGTRVIAQALGAKMDPKVEEALNTAQKITQGVQVAQQVAEAFSSNGLLGAFSVLSGSGGVALTMGPVGVGASVMAQAQMNAQLGEVNKKLDKVIQLQKEILELQKQTLAKIEELSYKVDRYHQEEMHAIDSVKQEVINSRRAVRKLIDDRLGGCFSLVNRMSSLSTKENLSLNLFSTMSDRSILAHMLADIGVRNRLQNEDGLKASYADCSRAMTDAFSFKAILMTPLTAFLESNNYNYATPLEIETQIYKPALANAISTFPGKTVDSLALHLPSSDFKGLERKAIYMNRKIQNQTSNLESRLKDTISTESLERYVGALLSLHPMLSVSAESWDKMNNVVTNALNGSRDSLQKQNQSEFWLRSALENVNTAIAQTALIAGEPLMPSLMSKFDAILSETGDCQTVHPPYCYVRQNAIMSKNILNYYLYQKVQDPQFLAAYIQAFNSKSDLEIVKLLGALFIGKVSWESRPLLTLGIVNTTIPFPTPEEAQKGSISYPSELSHLVKMQEKIADELTKVTPNSLDPAQQEFLTELTLFQKD